MKIMKTTREILSTDNLHHRLDKHIKLVVNHTNIKPIDFIIKSCRLKPHDLIFNKFNLKLVYHKKWIDEHYNSLTIKKKLPIITLNDLTFDRHKLTSSDLYEHVSMIKVAKFAKLIYVLSGQEEDFNEDYVIISFLGVDNYLRTFVYLYDEWKYYPSLFLGLETLTEIANNKEIKYFINLNKNNLYPCNNKVEWLSYWPAEPEFLAAVQQQSEFTFQTINYLMENIKAK